MIKKIKILVNGVCIGDIDPATNSFNNSFKGIRMIVIQVGQIWANDSSKIRIRVKEYIDRHVTVELEEKVFFGSGYPHEWIYEESDFLDEYTLCSAGAAVSSIGARCDKCGKDYPYADVIVGFRCWGCKNGF